MAAPRRPDPEPLDTNEFAPVIVATGLWLVAFVVLLIEHHHMAARGQGWWLWVGLAGFLLGLWGLTLMHLHHRRRAQKDRIKAARDAAAG